jgi:hypothetical protein
MRGKTPPQGTGIHLTGTEFAYYLSPPDLRRQTIKNEANK